MKRRSDLLAHSTRFLSDVNLDHVLEPAPPMVLLFGYEKCPESEGVTNILRLRDRPPFCAAAPVCLTSTRARSDCCIGKSISTPFAPYRY